MYNEVIDCLEAIAEVKNVSLIKKFDGTILPRVEIEPTRISGTIIYCVSGFSFKYIEENNISRGAKIKICIQQKVIPVISEVIEEGKIYI